MLDFDILSAYLWILGTNMSTKQRTYETAVVANRSTL